MRTKDEAVKPSTRGARRYSPTVAFSQAMRYPTLDDDRVKGCIRDKAHATRRMEVWRYSMATSRRTAAS